MKLREALGMYSKDEVYDFYVAICYSNKEYEKITKNKMIDEIINQFQFENYLYDLCTKRELDFLKLLQAKKIKKNNLAKYEWEIKELNKKLILDNLTIYEDQEANVKKALEYYQKNSNKSYDYLAMFVIGFVKINANFLVDVLISIVNKLFNIESEEGDYLGHPLIHFYCDFYLAKLDSFKEFKEIIFYKDYYSLLEEINNMKKEYGMAGTLSFSPQDYIDTFYYGFPLSNNKVKAMYQEISKIKEKDFMFRTIDLARIFNDNDFICKELLNEKQFKLVEDALLEMPCAIMNGFSPRTYYREKGRESKLESQFIREHQVDAKLSKKEADDYYKFYLALLEFVNNNYKLNPKIKKIYKQEGLDVNELIVIDDYLWEHKDTLIDEFISKNPYHFKKEELATIAKFKEAKTGMYIIVGFTKDYTMFLADGIIYMVKGINDNLDNIINPLSLPYVIMTTLLMFNGKIIYNSFFKEVNIKLGNHFNQTVLNDIKKALKYYHL